MNIKKFDTELYYSTIEKKTQKSEVQDGIFFKTIDYEFKNINYIIPTEHYNYLNTLINEYITTHKTFKLNEIEGLISDYTFKVYKKRVAAKKITLLYLNQFIIDKKIYTNNGFNFATKKSLL